MVQVSNTRRGNLVDWVICSLKKTVKIHKTRNSERLNVGIDSPTLISRKI